MAQTIWRLICKPQSGQFILRIEYQSEHALIRHEEEHKKRVEQAKEFLRKAGHDETALQLEFHRVACHPPTSEPIPVPPIPQEE